MFVAVAVAIRAADVHPCMSDGDILLHIVDVANKAAAIVSHRFGGRAFIRFIIKQQQRFIIKQQWFIIEKQQWFIIRYSFRR